MEIIVPAIGLLSFGTLALGLGALLFRRTRRWAVAITIGSATVFGACLLSDHQPNHRMNEVEKSPVPSPATHGTPSAEAIAPTTQDQMAGSKSDKLSVTPVRKRVSSFTPRSGAHSVVNPQGIDGSPPHEGRPPNGATNSQQDIAIEVFAIVNATSVICPKLKMNKFAAAALLHRVGVTPTEMLPDTPTMQKMDHIARSLFDKTKMFDPDRLQIYCNSLLSLYGPLGTAEPLLLEPR